MPKHLKILILVLFSNLTSFGQSYFETDLNEAFKKSKKENKNLIIYRCDSTKLKSNYYRSFPVTYYSLDSIFNIQDLKKEILNEFVFLKLEKNTTNSLEIEFNNKFINEYENPNLIIFSSDSSLLTYITAESHYTALIKDFFSEIKKRISENKENSYRLKELEEKRKINTLTNTEPLELIRLRATFNLKSRNHFNELALKSGKLSGDFKYLVENQDFKSHDPFVTYLLKYDKENNMFWEQTKHGLINDILKNAKLNSDKIEFESSLLLQENYYFNLIQKNKDSSMVKYQEQAIFDLKESQKYARVIYYIGISDTLNIVKNGLAYADSLTENYQKKRDYYLKVKMPISNYFNESDSQFNERLKNKQKYFEELVKSKTREYDEEQADLLNYISWNFYKYTTDSTNLKKALKWSEFSLKLNSTPEKIDTYAHLLFALGQTNKAINAQMEAIKAAEKDEIYKELIENMKLDLKRFQNK